MKLITVCRQRQQHICEVAPNKYDDLRGIRVLSIWRLRLVVLQHSIYRSWHQSCRRIRALTV
jgi:hypothetical protein